MKAYPNLGYEYVLWKMPYRNINIMQAVLPEYRTHHKEASEHASANEVEEEGFDGFGGLANLFGGA